MIESLENAVQLTVTGACSVICFTLAVRMSEKEWDILALFYAAVFLGDLYWQLSLILNHDIPRLSYVSEFAWYAAYMFLLILVRYAGGEKAKKAFHPIMWVVPPFVIGMCIFYMQYGAYLSNIITAILMGMLMWNSIKGILIGNIFCKAALVMCLVEYSMWTASCFFSSEGITNPYYWFDFMFTMSMLSFLPLFAKVVKA